VLDYLKQHMPANTKYDWYANSLNAEHPNIKGHISALKDDYGLIKRYKERWIWGADGTGDITNPDNIRWYGEYITRKFAGSGGVHVVTGDAGLNIGEAPLEILQKLDFAQMVMVACTSSPGSCCIIKHFLPYLADFDKLSSKSSGFFMSFMYMYQLMFREFHMFKPLSSSPGSGEFYVVARGFLGLDQTIKDKLLDALGMFRVNQPIFEHRDIPRWFVNKVAAFINVLTQRNIDNEVIGIAVLKCFINAPAEIDCSYYLSDAGGAGTFKEQKEKDIKAWMDKYKYKV
jgi:cap2 methyltransferase